MSSGGVGGAGVGAPSGVAFGPGGKQPVPPPGANLMQSTLTARSRMRRWFHQGSQFQGGFVLCVPIPERLVRHVVGKRGAVIRTIELDQYTQARPGGLGEARIRIDDGKFDLMGIQAQNCYIDARTQLRCALAAQAIEQIVIDRSQRQP